VFPTTLGLQLRVARLTKLLSHVSAMDSPTLRQRYQARVTPMCIGALRIDSNDWKEWCDPLRRESSGLRQASLPQRGARVHLARQIRERDEARGRKRTRVMLTVSKRPAAKVQKSTSVLRRPAGARVRDDGRRATSVQESRVDAVAALPAKRTAFTRRRVVW